MNKNVGYLKYCEVCHMPYTPTSNRQRYCPVCGPEAKHQNHIERCRRYHLRTYEYKGYNQQGTNNNRLKKGQGSGRNFNEYAQYRKDSCEICARSVPEVPRLVIHHKDGDCMNNHLSNLVTLCDTCHKLVHNNKIIL